MSFTALQRVVHRHRGAAIAVFGFASMYSGSAFMQAVLKPDMTIPTIEQIIQEEESADEEQDDESTFAEQEG